MSLRQLRQEYLTREILRDDPVDIAEIPTEPPIEYPELPIQPELSCDLTNVIVEPLSVPLPAPSQNDVPEPSPIVCDLVKHDPRTEVEYPVQYLCYPPESQVSEDDISQNLVAKEGYMLIWGVLPTHTKEDGSLGIHPSFKIACREGAEEGGALIPPPFIAVMYTFDREEVASRLKGTASQKDLLELGVGYDDTPADDFGNALGGLGNDAGVNITDYTQVQQLQGDAQLRAIMQLSQHENEELEIALAMSLNELENPTISPISVMVEDDPVEGGASCSSDVQTDPQTSESTSEIGSPEHTSPSTSCSDDAGEPFDDFDFRGVWRVVDVRFFSAFFSLPFKERPFFISGREKFSLIPEQWNVLKKRYDMLMENDDLRARMTETFMRRYGSALE